MEVHYCWFESNCMLFLFGSRKVMVLTLKFVHTEKTFTWSYREFCRELWIYVIMKNLYVWCNRNINYKRQTNKKSAHSCFENVHYLILSLYPSRPVYPPKTLCLYPCWECFPFNWKCIADCCASDLGLGFPVQRDKINDTLWKIPYCLPLLGNGPLIFCDVYRSSASFSAV